MVVLLKMMQSQQPASNGDGSPAQQKSLVDVTNELVQVRDNMVKLCMVKDPNALPTVETTPIEDPIITKIKGAIAKRIEAVADEIVNPKPATASPTPENPMIPTKIAADGTFQIDTGGMTVKLPPEKFIELQKLNNDFTIRKLEADAKINDSKTLSKAVMGFLEPAGEAVAETVKGFGGENGETKKEFIDVACPDCLAKNVKTMLRIADYEKDGDFECPLVKDVHPDKPTLHWKPSNVPIAR